MVGLFKQNKIITRLFVKHVLLLILAGIRPLICLDSDSESELDVHMITARKSGTHIALPRLVEGPWINICSHIVEKLKCSGAEKGCSMFSVPTDDGVLKNYDKNDKNLLKNDMHGTIDERKGSNS